jgi:hypothetical protein
VLTVVFHVILTMGKESHMDCTACYMNPMHDFCPWQQSDLELQEHDRSAKRVIEPGYLRKDAVLTVAMCRNEGRD